MPAKILEDSVKGNHLHRTVYRNFSLTDAFKTLTPDANIHIMFLRHGGLGKHVVPAGAMIWTCTVP